MEPTPDGALPPGPSGGGRRDAGEALRADAGGVRPVQRRLPPAGGTGGGGRAPPPGDPPPPGGVGSDPVIMFPGVAPATHKALDRAGLALDAIDVIEISEAFAPVVLAWASELEPDMARVNPNGGAIPLGHPGGASGAR